MRFVSGRESALYTIGTLLAAEYVPTRVRTTVLGTLQAGWAVGFVAAALLAAYLLPRFGWRPLFGCAVVPASSRLRCFGKCPTRRAGSHRGGDPCRARGRWRSRGALDRSSVRRPLALDRDLDRAVRVLRREQLAADIWSRISASIRRAMGWFIASTYAMTVVGKIVCGYLGDVLGRRAVLLAAGLLSAVPAAARRRCARGECAVPLLAFGFLYAAPVRRLFHIPCRAFRPAFARPLSPCQFTTSAASAQRPAASDRPRRRALLDRGWNRPLGVAYALCAWFRASSSPTSSRPRRGADEPTSHDTCATALVDARRVSACITRQTRTITACPTTRSKRASCRDRSGGSPR